MKLFRTLLLLVPVLPLVLVGPAEARAVDRTDVTKDVRVYQEADGDVQPAGPVSTDPKHDNGDIKKIRVRVDKTTVRVVLYFRALRAQGDTHEYQYKIRTAKTERNVKLLAYPSYWSGSPVYVSKPDGTPVVCAGKRSIDYAANVVKLSVPASCFGNPTWASVAVRVYQLNLGNASYDKAYAKGGSRFTDVYGPRAYR